MSAKTGSVLAGISTTKQQCQSLTHILRLTNCTIDQKIIIALIIIIIIIIIIDKG
jgi:hypothetical protein